MENLWAAWRRDFILGPREDGCIFCNRVGQDSDRENYILYRGQEAFVLMNKYPYNAGHLMVVPNTHKGDLGQLTEQEANELFSLSIESVRILKEAMPADGFNLGLNLGEAAGAGVRDHVHIHVVPRFKGDTNFMPIVGKVKVQSFSLHQIYDKLKPGFDRLKSRT